jgi:hypothetical protein
MGTPPGLDLRYIRLDWFRWPRDWFPCPRNRAPGGEQARARGTRGSRPACASSIPTPHARQRDPRDEQLESREWARRPRGEIGKAARSDAARAVVRPEIDGAARARERGFPDATRARLLDHDSTRARPQRRAARVSARDLTRVARVGATAAARPAEPPARRGAGVPSASQRRVADVPLLLPCLPRSGLDEPGARGEPRVSVGQDFVPAQTHASRAKPASWSCQCHWPVIDDYRRLKIGDSMTFGQASRSPYHVRSVITERPLCKTRRPYPDGIEEWPRDAARLGKN